MRARLNGRRRDFIPVWAVDYGPHSDALELYGNYRAKTAEAACQMAAASYVAQLLELDGAALGNWSYDAGVLVVTDTDGNMENIEFTATEGRR